MRVVNGADGSLHPAQSRLRTLMNGVFTYVPVANELWITEPVIGAGKEKNIFRLLPTTMVASYEGFVPHV
jgi:hypothetical protein